MSLRPVLVALALAACGCTAFASPGAYALDAAASRVAVDLVLFGNRMGGSFAKKAGTLLVAPDGGAALVDLQVETASVASGVAADDEKLRGDHILDVHQYPKARLVIPAVPLASSPSTAAAQVTLHGHTAPARVTAGAWACEPESTGTEKCNLPLDVELKLADFDMDSLLPGTPKVANLNVVLVTVRKSEPTPAVAATPPSRPKPRRAKRAAK